MTVPEDGRKVAHDYAADPLPAALMAIAEQGERIAQLDVRAASLGVRLEALERPADEHRERAGYAPIPAARWWMLPPADRADAVDRLAAWVEQVYTASYGHLAKMLAPCWRDHDLCLFILDFVSELHSVLYLRPSRSARTLADQAEYTLRILPVAAELMRAETARCDHPPTHRSPMATIPMRGTGSARAGAPGRARSYVPPGDAA
jgi:hypothetical protein